MGKGSIAKCPNCGAKTSPYEPHVCSSLRATEGQWQYIEMNTLRKWIGDNVKDLGRLRIAADGELEYCDTIILKMATS